LLEAQVIIFFLSFIFFSLVSKKTKMAETDTNTTSVKYIFTIFLFLAIEEKMVCLMQLLN
jgi:hypothetical protein